MFFNIVNFPFGVGNVKRVRKMSKTPLFTDQNTFLRQRNHNNLSFIKGRKLKYLEMICCTLRANKQDSFMFGRKCVSIFIDFLHLFLNLERVGSFCCSACVFRFSGEFSGAEVSRTAICLKTDEEISFIHFKLSWSLRGRRGD